jgi:phosphoribosylglycinamide formyltransferase-1
MKNIAIFASGSGTNAEAIANHLANHDSLNVCLIAANKSDAYVLTRAKNLGITSTVFNRKDLENGSLIEELKFHKIDYVVLAGFLLKIPPVLIAAFPNRIINIHPALLPKYGGKGMYGERVHQAVIENKESVSGITIHYVNEHFDKGEIIHKRECKVSEFDTATTLAAKIHELEHKYFPQQIEKLWG